MAIIHVVGGGLAGLAAAVDLSEGGHRVRLYEAADQAGGRCRSYYDNKLEQVIDNGNHLMMSGNRAVLAYLGKIGATDTLIGPARACYPFYDAGSGERWTLRPGRGRIPWWLLDPARRVPGSRVGDYLGALALLRAGPGQRVGDCLRRDGALWHRFWEPLTVAALNTAPEEASAQLLWRVVRETFFKGEAACRPLIARESLAASLVEPALALLRSREVDILLNKRVRALTFQEDRVRALWTGEGEIMVEEGDALVVALPPWGAADLLPGLAVPQDHRAIVNAHILLPEGATPTTPPPRDSPLLGLIGCTAHWLFLRGRTVSLTVSAADALAARPNEELARVFWGETADALGLPPGPPSALPPIRIIKEKRATFAQTPEALAQRPGATTTWRNLALAGDWTDTGFPATIESAVASGQQAAAALSRRISLS